MEMGFREPAASWGRAVSLSQEGRCGRADLSAPGPARCLLQSSGPSGAGMALCQKETKREVDDLSMTSCFSNVWPTSA